MGVLLQAPQDAAPSTSDPFLVVDDKLTVCALSRQAERLLGLSETEAVNRHIGELLVPGDTESSAGESLAAVLTWAARGDAPLRNIVVRRQHLRGALAGLASGRADRPTRPCWSWPTRAEPRLTPRRRRPEARRECGRRRRVRC